MEKYDDTLIDCHKPELLRVYWVTHKNIRVNFLLFLCQNNLYQRWSKLQQSFFGLCLSCVEIDLASHHATIDDKFKITPCLHPRCKCCFCIPDVNINKIYNVSLTADMDYNSKDLIYLIICSKCKKKYVGETTRKLKDRLNNHISDIRLKKNTSYFYPL